MSWSRALSVLLQEVMTKSSLSALVFALGVSSAASGTPTTGGFMLVVNASRPATLTRQQVADIFMMRATRWSDGTPVTPFDLSVEDPTRQVFSKSMLGQSPESVVYHWRQQLTTRYVKPPLVKSETDVLAVVGATPGAIGYVAEGTELPDGVRPVVVVETASR
jgi:ABC-type phosphate transport system substrate-binding protein